MNKHHVFAVLSQYLCLDTVLASSEAMKLADHSVTHHMRLLIGISTHPEFFYTALPLEPILALGSANLLYDSPDNLKCTLATLASELCSVGLVNKGSLGELATCMLLLIACNFSSI
jgi:hypothetical protein